MLAYFLRQVFALVCRLDSKKYRQEATRTRNNCKNCWRLTQEIDQLLIAEAY